MTELSSEQVAARLIAKEAHFVSQQGRAAVAAYTGRQEYQLTEEYLASLNGRVETRYSAEGNRELLMDGVLLLRLGPMEVLLDRDNGLVSAQTPILYNIAKEEGDRGEDT